MTNRKTMPTTFADIVDAMRGKSHLYNLCNNTDAYLIEEGGDPAVLITLHGHAIVRLWPNGTVDVRHCGYPTVTTFDRIKRFLPNGYTATRQGGDPRILRAGSRWDDVCTGLWTRCPEFHRTLSYPLS